MKEYKIIIGLNDNYKNYNKWLEDLKIIENLRKRIRKKEEKITFKEKENNNFFSHQIKVDYHFLILNQNLCSCFKR